jgi:hypothetical protein
MENTYSKNSSVIPGKFNIKSSIEVLKSGQPFDVNDDGVWGETPRATLLPKSQ